jgi:UDP-glucose 4-epimerase
MRFVVTGGAGFIGSHLAEALVRRGHEVVVLDNLTLGKIENVPRGVKAIVARTSMIKTWNLKCDCVFHLGMPSSSPMYKNNPKLVGETINDAIALFDYASKKKVKVVVASTSSIYNGNPLPWREDMPIHVTDFYTECRYAIERLARLYHDLYGLKVIILRLFSVYGPREEHKGEYANVISQMIWSVMRREPFIVYGDGNQSRDFIYVGDVVEAFIKAMESDIDYDIFNVGFGKNYSFNEVAKMISDALGREVRLVHKPNPIKNYVYHTLADTTKAEKVLGFKAKTPLREGIENTIRVYNVLRY